MDWIVIAIAFVIFYFLYYSFVIVTETEIHQSSPFFSQSILKSWDSIKIFKPSFFFADRHSQCIVARLASRGGSTMYTRDVLRMKDGGEISLDWEDKNLNATDDDAPIVLVLHGLVGSSNSNYIRSCINHLRNSTKWKIVCLNARGCGNTPLKTPLMFHAGWTSDLRETVNHIKGRYPRAPLMAVAYSLGANILSKYLGEEGSQSPFVTVVGISNPFDFIKAGEHATTDSTARFYNRIFTKSLLSYVKKNQTAFEQVLDIPHVMKAVFMTEFDERVVCKIWGYKDPMSYYSENASVEFLKDIKTPTLFINAADDPIIPRKVIPFHLAKENANLCFFITSRGGHCAFLQGLRFWQPTWADEVVVDYLQKSFSVLHAKN